MSHALEEVYKLYAERERVARKPHDCDACAETVPPGVRYTAVFIVSSEGRPERLKRCARCQALHEHLRLLAPGDVWPNERLACGMDYEEEWGPLPPEVAALAFALPMDGAS